MSYLSEGEPLEVRYIAQSAGEFALEAPGAACQARILSADNEAIELELDGVRRRYRVVRSDARVFVHSPLGSSELECVPRFPPARRSEIAGSCSAPMPGVIREVRVQVGERVETGTVLLVLEAMKMEHQIIAPDAGVVKELRVEVGQMVEPDDVLIVIEAEA